MDAVQEEIKKRSDEAVGALLRAAALSPFHSPPPSAVARRDEVERLVARLRALYWERACAAMFSAPANVSAPPVNPRVPMHPRVPARYGAPSRPEAGRIGRPAVIAPTRRRRKRSRRTGPSLGRLAAWVVLALLVIGFGACLMNAGSITAVAPRRPAIGKSLGR